MSHCCCEHCAEKPQLIEKKDAILFGSALLVAVVGACVGSIFGSVLFVIAYLLAGWEVLYTAGKNIIRGKIFDETFLMAVATLGAIGIGEYPEAVAVMLFYRIGEMLEHYAVGRSKQSISELLKIAPERATVVRGIEIKTVSPEEVMEGDVILIKPGERVPLDAKIIEGSSSLDTSALTGESLPRDVKKGDVILSGCINLNGALHARVLKNYAESTVSTVLNLMENASEKKSKSEAFIGRFARIYTPVVVGLALVVALVPPLAFSADWSVWVYRALLFLMVSCPCALVLSVPLTYFCGLGRASKIGVLIKGSRYIAALADTTAVVFDKTGTLTEGQFAVSKVISDKMSRDDLLCVAAHVESRSNHPIARSICAAWQGEIDQSRIGEVKELPGFGICAKIDGRTVVVGNLTLMQDLGIAVTDVGTESSVHLALDATYIGSVTVSDQQKKDSEDTVSKLKELGVERTVMLTGDRADVAQEISEKLGIDEMRAELLPDQKMAELERILSETDGTLVYVGDGINDAPSIARADVGVAMGAIGSDAAVAAADVVIMTDELARLSDAIEISRTTEKIVRQNTCFILTVKAIVLLLGVFGAAGLWQAVFADVGVTLLAVLNSARAMKK